MPCLSTEDNNGYTYCDFCRRQWHEKCPVHQLRHIPDTPVPISGNQKDPDYAKKTMPTMFCIGPSRIPDAGLGVYAKEEIPMGCMFGPYRGEFVETPINDNYAWGIRDKNGKEYAYIDGSDVLNSNWLRYVNCARNTLERNLIAYQFEDDIYYRTCTSVPQDSELLVFYGYEFAKTLGIRQQSFDLPNNSNIASKTKLNNSPSLDDRHSGCSLTANEGNDRESKLRSEKSMESLVNTCFVKLEGTDSENTLSVLKLELEKATEIENITCTIHEYDKLETSSNGEDSHGDEDLMEGDYCVIGGTAMSKDVSDLSRSHENNLENTIDKNPLNMSKTDLELRINDDNLLNRDDCDFRYDPNCNFKDGCKPDVCKKKIFICDDCEYVTSDKGDLTYHISAVHLNVKYFKCPHCEYFTKNKTHVSYHIKAIHLNVKDFKCPHCEFCTSYVSNLKNHMKAIHFNVKDFKCPLCEFSTSHELSLTNHIKSIHLNVKDIKCPHCEYCTSNKRNLSYHLKSIHSNVKDLKCTHCDYCTSNRRTLRYHIKSIHLNAKGYKCPHCSFSSCHKINLTRHVKAIHLNVINFNCPYCEYVSTHKSNINDHIKAIHLNVKDSKCPHCEFVTSYIRNLKNHIKAIHMNVKDFKCTHCAFSTSHKISLNRHIKALHLNDVNFKCPHCKFVSSKKGNLNSHIKSVHSNAINFKCPHCEYVNRHKRNVKNHIRSNHSNAKDFKCPHCEYVNRNKRNMKNHLKEIHSNV